MPASCHCRCPMPMASAQTGYPPGPCVPGNVVVDYGTRAIGETFTIRMVTKCLWDPGNTVDVTGQRPARRDQDHRRRKRRQRRRYRRLGHPAFHQRPSRGARRVRGEQGRRSQHLLGCGRSSGVLHRSLQGQLWRSCSQCFDRARWPRLHRGQHLEVGRHRLGPDGRWMVARRCRPSASGQPHRLSTTARQRRT